MKRCLLGVRCAVPILFLCAAGLPGLGEPPVAPVARKVFGWRGDGTGKFVDADPPLAWSESENVRWSAEVGNSFSSPAVTEKFVLLTVEPNWIVCLERATGKQAWKVRPELADKKERAAADDYVPPKDGAGNASATPVTDGETVFAAFASGVVCAFDLQGRQKWAMYIGAEQNTGYGRAASPVLAGGKLIVHMTNLYALDTATGRQAWVNEDTPSGYGTPAAMKVEGVDVVVTSSGDVARVDTGKVVNSHIGHTLYASPVADGDAVYFFGAETMAVKLAERFKDEALWNGLVEGDVIGSPVFANGCLFGVNAKGDLYVFESKGAAGEVKPKVKKLMGGGGDDEERPAVAYASVALAGHDKKYLFVATTKGEVVILEATAEAKEVGRVKMKHGTRSTPVFAEREMFLRDGSKLFCIGK